MTFKPITCPQCGKLLCRAKIGSIVELKDGGVHALPLAGKAVRNSKAV